MISCICCGLVWVRDICCAFVVICVGFVVFALLFVAICSGFVIFARHLLRFGLGFAYLPGIRFDQPDIY